MITHNDDGLKGDIKSSGLPSEDASQEKKQRKKLTFSHVCAEQS